MTFFKRINKKASLQEIEKKVVDHTKNEILCECCGEKLIKINNTYICTNKECNLKGL